MEVARVGRRTRKNGPAADVMLDTGAGGANNRTMGQDVPSELSIQDEIDRAIRLGQNLEDIVLDRGNDGGLVIRGGNDDLLIGYWSLILDYDKGILCLLHHKFYSAAFALLRPLIEALVKAHVVKMGSEEDVGKIRKDRYNLNYDKVGRQIDEALGIGPIFENYLKRGRPLLHSLTHSGVVQLNRRFDGNDVSASFSDEQIEALVSNAKMAVFLFTILVTRHFDFDEGWRAAKRMFLEYVSDSRSAKLKEGASPDDIMPGAPGSRAGFVS
jgi:hypothetical protein